MPFWAKKKKAKNIFIYSYLLVFAWGSWKDSQDFNQCGYLLERVTKWMGEFKIFKYALKLVDFETHEIIIESKAL